MPALTWNVSNASSGASSLHNEEQFHSDAEGRQKNTAVLIDTSSGYRRFSDQSNPPEAGVSHTSHSIDHLWRNGEVASNISGLTQGSVFEQEAAKPAHTASVTTSSSSVDHHEGWAAGLPATTFLKEEYSKTQLVILVLALFVGLIVALVTYRLLRAGKKRYVSIETKLRRSLKSGRELRLNYQPIVNLNTGAWVGVESLIRWTPNGKPLSAELLISAAEQTGMMNEVTRWVVRRVAEDYSQYLWACRGLYITVNISAQDLEDLTFPDFVHDLLAEYGVPANVIVFEVTETALLDRGQAVEQLRCLREHGHRIAVDDFGTGYSSLSYLNELPLDIMKIDRSFLNPERMLAIDALWPHLVQMANTLNLVVVAEGIEQQTQATELSKAGVIFGQGWLYGRDFAPSMLAKHFFRLRQ